MEAEPGTDESIRCAFQSHIDSLNNAPEWWKAFKRDAFESYLKAPVPQKSDENWRFANRKGLDLSHCDFNSDPNDLDTQSLIDKSRLTTSQSGAFAFADNQTILSESASAALLEKGVIWCTLSEAIMNHEDLLKDYFMKQAVDLGSKKYADLHSAFVANGVLLYVPKGVEVDAPFYAYNWAVSKEASVFPHTLVIAEEHSRVHLVETHLSSSDQPSLSCGVTHLFAGVGANVDYTLIQGYNEETLGFQINSNIAGKDSQVDMNSVVLGCKRYRAETHGQIKGPGAHIDMRSLALTDAGQEIDQRTLQTHSAPHATSNILFKNALKEQSKTIFSGLIKVDESAQQTDAYQTNRNLLLDSNAEANSLPGLEIEANDVKCSHGATTSEIQDDEIFYMRARGIPKDAAQELIVYGFFEEILGRIEDESLANYSRKLIQAKFRGESV